MPIESLGIGATHFGSEVALAEAGADVVLSSRTQVQLKEVASRVKAAGRRAVVVAADPSDVDDVRVSSVRSYATVERVIT